MKEILIVGKIGWDITASGIRNELAKIGQDEDCRIVIDSPGGSVFDMVPIFNLIRDFARNRTSKVDTYIQGLAASCASVIALAANAGNPENKILVEDNSIYMIHNAWCIAWGDHREMEAEGKELSRIDALLKAVYITKTQKTDKEITDMMDAETFLYGKEIVDAGFAHEVIENLSVDPVEEPSTKDALIVSAKNSFSKMKVAMQERIEKNKEEYKNSRAAACAVLDKYFGKMTSNVRSENKNQPGDTGLTTEEPRMNLEELKAKYPELYNEVYNMGVNAERSRVQAHVKMAKDSGDINAALEFIDSGVNCGDNECVAKYHEVFTKNALAKARAADTVPDTTVPPATDEGADAEMKAFLAETGLKGAE